MVESWIIALIIPVIGFIFAAGSLYQKFRNIEQDIKSIKKQLNDIGENKNIHDQLINSQRAAFSAYIEAFTSLIASLVKANPSISSDLISIQSKLTSDAINKTLQAIAGGTGNPVSADEARRLQSYVERARRNEIFTSDEAQDFYNLSQRVSQDRSGDGGAWGIFLLAAFIFALYVLSKKK